MKKLKKYKYIILLVLIILGSIFYIVNINNEDEIKSTFKCPEEMNSIEEYLDNRAHVGVLIKKRYPELSWEEVINKIMDMTDSERCHNDVEYLQEYKESINGEYAPIELVSEDQLNREDLIEHDSKSGFTFKYPPNTDLYPIIMDNYLIVVEDKENENSKIIISVAINTEGLTAKEWFLGSNSGFNQNKDIFFETEIDGQPAVYTDKGTWVVFNTPVDNYRVSIADLTVEDAEVMYEEMGIILGTLKFE